MPGVSAEVHVCVAAEHDAMGLHGLGGAGHPEVCSFQKLVKKKKELSEVFLIPNQKLLKMLVLGCLFPSPHCRLKKVRTSWRQRS